MKQSSGGRQITSTNAEGGKHAAKFEQEG